MNFLVKWKYWGFFHCRSQRNTRKIKKSIFHNCWKDVKNAAKFEQKITKLLKTSLLIIVVPLIYRYMPRFWISCLSLKSTLCDLLSLLLAQLIGNSEENNNICKRPPVSSKPFQWFRRSWRFVRWRTANKSLWR